jgi:hypothetical protein
VPPPGLPVCPTVRAEEMANSFRTDVLGIMAVISFEITDYLKIPAPKCLTHSIYLRAVLISRYFGQ